MLLSFHLFPSKERSIWLLTDISIKRQSSQRVARWDYTATSSKPIKPGKRHLWVGESWDVFLSFPAPLRSSQARVLQQYSSALPGSPARACACARTGPAPWPHPLVHLKPPLQATGNSDRLAPKPARSRRPVIQGGLQARSRRENQHPGPLTHTHLSLPTPLSPLRLAPGTSGRRDQASAPRPHFRPAGCRAACLAWPKERKGHGARGLGKEA